MAAIIVPKIIADAYLESNLSATNVVAADAIRYTDDVYQELIDIKKLANEDFVRLKGTTNTVLYTNEYDLPSDFEKMKQISIKYTAPTYDAWVTLTDYVAGQKVTDSWLAYICKADHTAGATFAWDATNWKQIYEWYMPCRPAIVDFDKPEDFNWYTGFSAPIYFYFNSKIQIYPRPTEAVTQGIVYDYIPTLTTLTTSTDDSVVYIEPKLRKHWVKWVAMKFRQHIRDFDGANALKIDYEDWKEKCQERWEDRHYTGQWVQLPSSLTRYMR